MVIALNISLFSSHVKSRFPLYAVMRLVSIQKVATHVRAQTAPSSYSQRRRCAIEPPTLADDMNDERNPEMPSDGSKTIDLPLDIQGKEIRKGRDPTRSKSANMKLNLTNKKIEQVRQRALSALPKAEVRGKSLLKCIMEAEKKVERSVYRRHANGLNSIDDAPANHKQEVRAHNFRMISD